MAKKKQHRVFPVLRLFSEENYRGRSVTVRGAVAVRDLERRFDTDSLRFFSTNPNATLVIFSEKNFHGSFRIIRGNRNIRNIDDMESFVMANFHISEAQVRRLQRTGRLPRFFRVF
ncbi:hypothetical protein BEP19_15275 [Ammoniphilus oxalaticus]|uniref:Uncharacterized protein n=1 Tax=Ammoniphilus oxalaticus TaxID=66863 RepID=A0A419SD42_9BACL|nr:hypothetical protein [Ammoniphilus oxalaticus]RKD21039.1 hypothetical protein BEP19_15275 [Ammoniphilus oxalaticus]